MKLGTPETESGRKPAGAGAALYRWMYFWRTTPLRSPYGGESGSLINTTKNETQTLATGEEISIHAVFAGTYSLDSSDILTVVPTFNVTATLLDAEGDPTGTTYPVGTTGDMVYAQMTYDAEADELSVVLDITTTFDGPNGVVPFVGRLAILRTSEGDWIPSATRAQIDAP